MKTINNKTQDDYVVFDNAKLLKEKGFDIITDYIYMTNHSSNPVFENINRLKHSDGDNPFVSRPTIQLAVKWIYENFGYWIYCEIHKDKFYCKAKKVKSNWRRVISGIINNENVLYKSPQDAYQAAIKYCLIELIK